MDINSHRSHPHHNRTGLHDIYSRDFNAQTHLHTISDVHTTTGSNGNASDHRFFQ